MSCAAIKTVRVRNQLGGIFSAECDGFTVRSDESRESAAKVAAALAWSTFLAEKIHPNQIRLTGKDCTVASCTYEARCFNVTAAAKPLKKASVKRDIPQHTPDQLEHAFAACRTIKFAAADAKRRGTWDLTSLVAALRLAQVALGDAPSLQAAADMEDGK